MYNTSFWSYTNDTYKAQFATWLQSAPTRPYIGTMFAGWASLIIGYKYSPSNGAFWIMGADGNFIKWCHLNIQGDVVWD